MGEIGDNKPCDTTREEILASTDRPPYHDYCKYRVKFYTELENEED